MKKIILILSILVVLIILGCKKASKTPETKKFLNGAGASFPYPLYANWASEYYKLTKVKINYQSIGSGGGIRQIIEKTVDFGASDMPLKPEEVESKNLLQFPTAIGAIVPVVNLPEIKNFHLTLDGETLCEIYLGKIKKWNDSKIKSLNPGLNLPDRSITPIYRADASGTTAIFTKYLSQICKTWKKEIGFGTAVNWKIGVGAKGNEGVANYVKRTPYTIGYVEIAYAIQNKLSYIKLKNSFGKVVEPNEKNIKEAILNAKLDPSKHFYTWLTNVPGENAWPIVGATYILLSREKKETNKEVVKFFDWAFKNGDKIAEKLTYVPLSEEIKEKIRYYWKKYEIY
ncbi:MAG: ABC-type phosphate transport system [Thermodesulfobacteria bacterium]|nr:phosphate ABC transporter substrate-binding protein PstS [Thermodesulfobacteriota bacterium]MCU4138149.1 ABC-type phosphate transport system [Thermodesulfobacteriota bacterium]